MPRCAWADPASYGGGSQAPRGLGGGPSTRCLLDRQLRLMARGADRVRTPTGGPTASPPDLIPLARNRAGLDRTVGDPRELRGSSPTLCGPTGETRSRPIAIIENTITHNFDNVNNKIANSFRRSPRHSPRLWSPGAKLHQGGRDARGPTRRCLWPRGQAPSIRSDRRATFLTKSRGPEKS